MSHFLDGGGRESPDPGEHHLDDRDRVGGTYSETIPSQNPEEVKPPPTPFVKGDDPEE